MYAAIHETDDSTSVNLCAYGRFIPGSGSQLLTVGAKYLRLFRTNPYALVPPSDVDGEWIQRTKLECVFSVRLLSSVQDLAVARIPLFPHADSILLSFDDAKLSIVGVSGADRSLQTYSLHSYEDDMLRDGYATNAYPPIVRADPESRCAAMLLYGRHIAVLPFTDGSSHIHSYTVKLTSIDSRLENVMDMAFLNGYYEPTLLFLYEPLQTTAGRASIRSDTYFLMGVSLNTMDKQHAVVWQMSGLPMDCLRLQPIPPPVGGAVVVAANEIIYLNQSVPPCGVSVNSCLDNYTRFPLKDMKSLSVVLDASECAVVGSRKLTVSTKDGTLFLLTLVTDSTNCVKMIDMEHVYDISPPACMSLCASGHLFVGSRLGDSQLLSFSVSEEEVEEESQEENGESAAKKAHLEEELDDEDLALYGDSEAVVQASQMRSLRRVEKWSFSELDRLPSIGPIFSLTAGAPNDLSSTFSAQRHDPIFDIVTASGRGNEGALCILQRSIRPEILNSSSIEGATRLWSVGVREDGCHRYLLVARARSTLVLELGEEMLELETPLFLTNDTTIAAGELADGAVAVQVTSMAVCLVMEEQQLEFLNVDSNFPIVAASIQDPYVALLTQNGRVLLYKFISQPVPHLQLLDLFSTSLASEVGGVGISALCIYRDMSGLLMCESSGGRRKMRGRGKDKDKDGDKKEKPALDEPEDLEDLLLYGESKSKRKDYEDGEDGQLYTMGRKRRRGAVPMAQTAAGGEESDAVDPNSVVPSLWIVVARTDGRLLIYELPSIRVVYQVNKIWAMPPLLVDTTMADEEKEKKDAAVAALSLSTSKTSVVDAEAAETVQKPEERIAELSLVGMGLNQGRPVLFLVLDDLVIAYEMFSADNEKEGHLAIRFRRLPLTRSVRPSSFMGVDGKRAETETSREGGQLALIHTFDRLGSLMHGVFLAGPNPCLVLMSAWGGLRVHPFILDNEVLSFTPFNNENVLEGFLYLIREASTMRVARLNPLYNYELPFAMRKVWVKKSVHMVRYCLQSQVYVVVTSRSHRSNRLCTLMNDEKQIDAHPRPDSFVCPTIDEYAVDLYSDEDWKSIPNTGITLQEMEVVTSCEEVLLRSESTISGLQNYVAIGTICNYGEEVLIRGRIILMEIIEVVPEPGQPTSKHKMKVLYEKEQKGPVTALCACNGFLLTGMGQKVFIWQLRDNTLNGVSFLDMHFYVSQLTSLRTLALSADIFSSMSLIRFQEQFKVLSLASYDARPSPPPPMASAFVVDNDTLGFLLADEVGNLTFFNYMPREGISGEKLSIRGQLHIGTPVHAFLRVKGHTSAISRLRTAERRFLTAQQNTFWSSLDGSFGYVRGISEKSFRRLFCLQQSMATVVPQAAGLNPRGARAGRPHRPTVHGESSRNCVDVDVVEQFLHLSTSDKQELARKIGCNRYQMIDDLFLLQKLSSFF